MNQIFQNKNHLHFGATVYISSFNNGSKFYMYANGISLKTVLSIAESQSPYDPSWCLFVLKPPMKFQSEAMINKMLENRNSEEADQIEYDEKKTKAFIQQFQFQLKQNLELKQQQENYPLKYGEGVMLQHVFSSNYLSFKKVADNNQYNLQLTDIPNSSCIFNLKACYSYQKDIHTYIPFNSAAYFNIKFQQGLQVRQMNLNFIPNSIYDSWIFSQQSQDKLKIELYQTSQQIEYKNICFGDSIWIFHLESGSFIKMIDQQKQNSLILKKIKFTLGYSNSTKAEKQKQKVRNTDETQDMKTKIMVKKVENEMSAEKFGLWKIIPVLREEQGLEKSKFLGGRVKYGEQVRLLNIKYRTYLSVRKIKKGRNKFDFQLAAEQTEEQNTVFQIKNISSNGSYVTTEDLFIIRNISSNTYLTLQTQLSMNQSIGYLTPSPTYKKVDNFKFTKIDFIEEWQNNYLLSTIPFVTEGIKSLSQISQGNIKNKDEVMLRLMYQNLVYILTFSFDLTEGFQASENKLGKMTYNHFEIQKLLKQQGIIDKIMEILTFLNPSMFIDEKPQKKNKIARQGILNIIKKYGISAKGTSQNKKKVDVELLLKIVNTCFKILRNCCKSNTQNSLILFKNSNIIFKFLALGTEAENFVIDSFTNSQILQKFGHEHFNLIIDQYIKVYRVKKVYGFEIFILLSSLVKNDGRGIAKNQLEIFRLFYHDQNPLIIPFREIDGKFYVHKMQLRDFVSTENNQADILGYQLKFSAELTLDRNYICSKTLKQWYPLSTILKYLIDDPINNQKLKQSFVWIIINTYLNERPRFKKQIPLIFSVPYEDKNSKQKLVQQNYEYQMKVMKDSGLSASIIDDILSCIHQKDSMPQQSISKLKKFILQKIYDFSEQNKKISQFFSSKMQAYMTCLKYLIELSVFKDDQSHEIFSIIERISTRVQQTLNNKKNDATKLESTSFRELLLEMVEKNVIKKFNYSANYDGIEDEVSKDNICSVFINYLFYQNILLNEKDSKSRKQRDAGVKIVLQLTSILSKMKKIQKVNKFVISLSDASLKSNERSSKAVQKILIQQIFPTKEKKMQNQKENIFGLLILQFYNSNTYKINYLSLNHLLSQIFIDRISMQQLIKLQFNTSQKEKQEFGQLEKNCQNLKLLVQTSQIWLNIHEFSKGKESKYDPVRLLFISKIKKLLKYLSPTFSESNQPSECYKYSDSTSTTKQQIVANLKIHQQIFNFIMDYKILISKVKSGSLSNQQTKLFSTIIKYCYLFLYFFIYNSQQNKNLIRKTVKDNYMNGYGDTIDKIQLGQTMFIVQYLKNNYEYAVEFYHRNPQIFSKYHKYTTLHVRLLIALISFYNQPIEVNLQKFFISIFDFTSFKHFMMLNQAGNQFNLDFNLLLTQQNKQPFLYHIHAIEVILRISKGLQSARNTIRQHLKKSLSQQYLFSLLTLDDFYTKQNSSNCFLKVMIHFKAQIMRIIQLAYFNQQSKNNTLILNEFRRYNAILSKMIAQAPARQQNEQFRKIYLIKGSKQLIENKTILQIYQNYLIFYGKQTILQSFLNSIDQFCLTYKQFNQNVKDQMTEKMVIASEQIHRKVGQIYAFIHKKSKKSIENGELILQPPSSYPIPYQWLFFISSANRSTQQIKKKQLFTSFLIQSTFNQQIYKKFKENQICRIKEFLKTLPLLNLKQFLFLRKLSQFMEDAFEQLSNEPSQEIYFFLTMLIQFLTLWIECQSKQKAEQLRHLIGKSELIFPIINFFQKCKFDKQNKELFLTSLQFFNQLIGEDGNRVIQKIFHQYFTNKTDSIQFFMKIKQIFDANNLYEKAHFKCKKIYDSVQTLEKDTKLSSKSEFIILNFFIRLCEGSYRENQIFLSTLSNITSFNIMSGIWQILKIQSKKYGKNLINVENYHLITQCFSTIKQLVQGPCVQNQNQFLKTDFFLTVLEYFQFVIVENDLGLENVVQERLSDINKISPQFSSRLRIYLNRDKITQKWMPSQVKYRCISLICSLLSQNVSEESKNQLYTISSKIILNELDNVYQRYLSLGLDYSYDTLEAKQNSEVILPLGFKLYELLQYYPQEKISNTSPGLKFFRQNSRIVEILHHKLSIVVFPRVSQQISIGFQNKFIEQVDRSSINSKLRGLQDAEVQNKQSDFPYGYLLFICALIITIMDIIIYNQDSLPFVQYFNFYPVLRIYGLQQTEEIIATVLILICMLLSLIYLYLQFKGASYFKQRINAIYNGTKHSKTQKFIQIVKFLWNNLSYYHYFITLLLSILSIFNPFFDALLLLVQLNRRSQTFSAIIDAISSTLDQLLVVLLFTLVCTYALTTFLYYYLAQVDHPDQCATLYNCFVFSLDLGFRADAGIVGFTDDQATILEMFLNENLQQVIVDFIYLFIIKIIIQQIIGAIIIDKFASLRQNKEKIEEDENSNCFICGLGRTLLDREEDGFELHKEQYHNRWNYFQFLIYIRKSKVSNFSGIQLFVYEEQKKGKLSWFPINRSYHLQEKNNEGNDKQQEESEIEKLMKGLDLEITQLSKDVNEIWNLITVEGRNKSLKI